MSGFNFGNFDITSGLSSLTDQFQQVASTIESTRVTSRRRSAWAACAETSATAPATSLASRAGAKYSVAAGKAFQIVVPAPKNIIMAMRSSPFFDPLSDVEIKE